MQRRQPQNVRGKRWAVVIAILLVAVIVVLGIGVLRQAGKPSEAAAVKLPCLASQSVTPFGEYVLYYDGMSIFCITTSGSVRWNYTIGAGASFSVGPKAVVAWLGSQIYILNENGRSTYNDNLGQPVQLARIGLKYAAAVIGEDTKPRLVIMDLNGAPVDEEADAFSSRMLLDVGFYGDDGQYIWTLALDVYGTVANTVLNTFEVGQMNTGEISLGDSLTYKVLYDNQKLRVITTRQMRTFDYRGKEDTAATILVYGWKLVASEAQKKGDAYMLLAPYSQTTNQYAIQEVRLLTGANDRRYTLPSACVGVAVYNKSVYAFSSDYIYRTDMGAQRFAALNRPANMETPTDFLGMTAGGSALLASSDSVYAVAMP